MEDAEELASGSKDQSHIVKGKRTKRVRPQSPIPFSITANSSNQGQAEAEDDSNNGDKDDNDIYSNNNSSPSTFSTEHRHSTEEEEDMANCLILLAHGQSRESPKHAEEDGGMNYTKYSSRRFMEAASMGAGKAGFYVYECKTCNRTFPSFQALGGHRASHKKPKALAALMAINNSSDEDEFQFKNNNNNNNNNNSSNPFSLQLNNSRGNLYSNNNKPKVHECSVCGAEFTSGQALGGHMRRHRAPTGTNTTMPLEPEEQPRKRRNILSLDLDLNLPAPEDDQTESKFAFASKQQQQQQQQQQQHQANLVFSAPALVDCHY